MVLGAVSGGALVGAGGALVGGFVVDSTGRLFVGVGPVVGRPAGRGPACCAGWPVAASRATAAPISRGIPAVEPAGAAVGVGRSAGAGCAARSSSVRMSIPGSGSTAPDRTGLPARLTPISAP